MGEKGEGFTETTIKDTWTKPRGVESGEGNGDGWGGGGEMGEKGRKLYLNNNKILKKKKQEKKRNRPDLHELGFENS